MANFCPDSGPGPWPVVLLMHEGGFKGGGLYDGNLVQTAKDIRDAGYYVLIASYRLAPCGVILSQHQHDSTTAGIASGRPEEQTNDMKALVRAARADSHCLNHEVGVVGGSAGGTHAIEAALDINPTIPSTAWPGWTASQRAACAVSLSGAYNFSNRSTLTVTMRPQFIFDIENYTNSCNLDYQHSISPVALVPLLDSDNLCKPLYLINSAEDPMPFDQITDMQCALMGNSNIDSSLYTVLTIPGMKHAFAYWGDDDGTTAHHLVSYDVIQFLLTHLPQ